MGSDIDAILRKLEGLPEVVGPSPGDRIEVPDDEFGPSRYQKRSANFRDRLAVSTDDDIEISVDLRSSEHEEQA